MGSDHTRAAGRKPIIGLVGGIGSGKSLVAAELAGHGGRVINGDELGHEALRQPEIQRRIRERWGSEVFNERGEVDRRRLGTIVFADPKELRALEALSFPWIERRFREEAEQANHDPGVRFVVLDAAVMLEAGWNRVCDRLVYIDAPRELRLQRLAEHRRWTPEDVAARERAQWPLEEKQHRAEWTLDNSGSRERLAEQVEALVRDLDRVTWN